MSRFGMTRQLADIASRQDDEMGEDDVRSCFESRWVFCMGKTCNLIRAECQARSEGAGVSVDT